MITPTPIQWFVTIAVGISLLVLDWQVSGEVFKRALRTAGPAQRRPSPAPALATSFGERVLRRVIDAHEAVLPYAAFEPAASAEAHEAAQTAPHDDKGGFKKVA